MRVGLVGTGMLGEAVGMHLLDSGYELVAQNRTAQKTLQLQHKGATIVTTPKKVASECDVIITCVKDADVIRHIAFEADGIIEGAHKGLAVFDMSTINPLSSKQIAKKYAECGITMLDAPVMGGPNVAVDGKLVMMASGDKKTFELHKKLLDTIASRVFYLGDVGVAHSVKLAMNLQIAMLALAISEGITLARGASVDPKIFLEVLNATYFKTGMSQGKAYKMTEGSYEPTFLLRNLKKDLHTINEAADSFGLRLPMSKLAEDVYKNAVDSGLGDLDYTGILAHLETAAKNNLSK